MFGSESNQLTYHPLPGSAFSLGCTWSLPLVLSASGRFTEGSDDHWPHAAEAKVRQNNKVAACTDLIFTEISWAGWWAETRVESRDCAMYYGCAPRSI